MASSHLCVFRLLFFGLFLVAPAPAAAQDEVAAVAVQSAADEEPQAAATAEPVIPLESDDPEIAQRLNGLYAEISGLEQVRASVRSGVVTLSGTALSAEDRSRAEAVASRLAGVVSVENEVSVEHDVEKRIQPLVAGAREIFASVAAFLPLLMVALVVLAFFWIIGVVFTRSNAIFGRLAPNPLVRTLIGQIVRLAFIIVGLVLAMRIMGATTLLGSVLGAAGVIGLAVGFAIRDTIENYIASILLSIRRPFAPNDLVILEGHEGRVTRLNSRATFLTTPAGNEVRIPNALVYKAKIENYTAIPERRFEFEVGIGYENDLCEAIAIAYQAVLETQGVMADPEPSVIVDSLGDSTVVLIVRGWTDQRKFDFQKVKSIAIRSVKEAFDAHDISMPEPIQNVRTLRDRSKDRKPKHEERAEPVAEPATDTAPDRTIEGKVAELRSGAEEDLLTRAAPRE